MAHQERVHSNLSRNRSQFRVQKAGKGRAFHPGPVSFTVFHQTIIIQGLHRDIRLTVNSGAGLDCPSRFGNWKSLGHNPGVFGRNV
jgi:hypothetical protein